MLLFTGLGLYAAARTTPAFSVDTLAVEGASPEVAAEVRTALAPVLGESLLALDLGDLARRAEGVPSVAAVSFDRAFPHTLRIAVVPELPVAVLRQGAASWLAAASGRVVGEVEKGARAGLPRVWLHRSVDVRVGETLAGAQRPSLAVLGLLAERPLPFGVRSVAAGKSGLVLKLRTGLELRLGNALDLPVKLEVARRVLPELGRSGGYLDVSVPDRPVAAGTLDSQVEVESSGSTVP